MQGEVTAERIGSLLHPRSVALVGAAEKSAFSRIAFANLMRSPLAERTYLVNRRGAVTHGRDTVTSCVAIGEPVDLAYVMVPQAGMLDALSDAASAGIRHAVVLTAGYGEAGAAGRALQDELVAHARGLDIVLLGPNQLGFANLVDHIPVISVPGISERSGAVALLSQSGASSVAMIDFANNGGVDLSYVVTLGNEAMITAAHLLEFLVEDEQTRAISIFMETVREPERFAAAARRAAAAGKAVVVLKAGRSELSARTAAAHTGALVGDDRVIDAVFRDLGVCRVDTIEDMLVVAGLAAEFGPMERPGLGIVSISGGACDIVADTAQAVGTELPALAASTEQALAEVMPGYGTVQNPLDVTGAAIIDPSLFTSTTQLIAADPSVGAVAVVNTLPWEDTGGAYFGQVFMDAVGVAAATAPVPVVYVAQVVQPITSVTRSCLDRAGLRFGIGGLRQTVTGIGHLASWSAGVRALSDARPEPITLPGGLAAPGPWSEADARTLLEATGIPVVPGRVVADADAAVAAAAEFGGPVAIKIVSAELLHKSDVGGVQLDVRGADEVRVAAATLFTLADTLLVTPMRVGGVELLVGVVRDAQWGPMLAVAIGGVLVEVLDDAVLAPAPVTAARARAMLERLRGAALFRGVRGSTPADLDALASVVARVGDVAVALGERLESFEINPLHVDGATIEALDAVVTWT